MYYLRVAPELEQFDDGQLEMRRRERLEPLQRGDTLKVRLVLSLRLLSEMCLVLHARRVLPLRLVLSMCLQRLRFPRARPRALRSKAEDRVGAATENQQQ